MQNFQLWCQLVHPLEMTLVDDCRATDLHVPAENGVQRPAGLAFVKDFTTVQNHFRVVARHRETRTRMLRPWSHVL